MVLNGCVRNAAQTDGRSGRMVLNGCVRNAAQTDERSGRMVLNGCVRNAAQTDERSGRMVLNGCVRNAAQTDERSGRMVLRRLIYLVILASVIQEAHSLGCYVCTSINHDNRLCEDTFNVSRDLYHADCWATKKNRVGTYPATGCVKMIASDDRSGFSLTVRDCVVDDVKITSETEIGRESQCGWMRQIVFNDMRMDGCIMSCSKNGCNHSSRTVPLLHETLVLPVLIYNVILVFLRRS